MSLATASAVEHSVSTSRTDHRSVLCADLATAFAARARSREQHALLANALRGLACQCQEEGLLPFVDLPHTMLTAFGGNADVARILATVTGCLYLGIDILDDIADGDLPPHWDGVPPNEVHLVACTLLSTLPHLLVDTLPVAVATRAAIHCVIADGLLRMAAGQQRDLQLTGSDTPTVEAVETAVIGKSGEEVAMFASLVGWCAGADARQVDCLAAMGRALGTAGQLSSDCHDLFQSTQSRDLASGARTVPIVYHLQRLATTERGAFVQRLADAQRSIAPHATIRNELRASGALRFTAFLVEMYCQRAHQAVAQLQLSEHRAALLRAMIDAVSFFPRKGGGYES